MSKQPRGVTLANNWKAKEIEKLYNTKEEMLKNNIDKTLVDDYANEELENINKKYDERIDTYNKNKLKNDLKKFKRKQKDNIKKEIVNIINSEIIYEKLGINKKTIKKIIDNEKNKINKKMEYMSK